MASGSFSSASLSSLSSASLAEQELMKAIQEYQKRSGRLFPTWSEILEVAQGLGYSKTKGAALGGVLPQS